MVLVMTRPTKNRNGTYQTRIGVPTNLRDLLGKSELKRSLRTKNESEAKLRHPIVLAEFEAQLEQARRSLASDAKLTDAVIEHIVFTWRKNVSTLFAAQHEAINPYLSQYGGLIEGNSIPVESLLEDIHHLKLNSPKLVLKYQQLDSILSQFFNEQLDLYQVAANIESMQYRKLLTKFGFAYIKMTESALKKKVSDIDLGKHGAVLYDSIGEAKVGAGETFSDLWEEFKVSVNRREPDKAGKRLRDYSSAVKKLIRMYPKRDIASLTKADIAAFRNVLEQLPTRPKVDIAKLSFEDQIIKVDELSLATTTPSSVKKQIKVISTVFNYAIQQGKLQINPADGAVSDIRKTMPLNDEQGYSATEIRTIFASQLFHSNHSPKRSDYGRAHYWIPLMLYYTGARAEEIAQLYVNDLYLDDEIPHIHIHAGRDDQSVKTGHPRKVPIHQHILDLGFEEYVNSLEPNGRLFPKLTMGINKKYHLGVGKWFAKFVRGNLGIERDKIQPFHGFRHAFITSCRERNTRDDVQRAITGHSQNDVASQYGRYSLSLMNGVIQGVPKCM